MYRIMIIEDDAVIREELSQFLNKYGYEVVTPISFDAVLSEVSKYAPELILLDINLPVFDGYHFCREIRKHSDVPIIIVTSRDCEMDELMSMSIGADDFVTKPYNTQILLARIATVLKRVYGGVKVQDVLFYEDFSLNLSNATVIKEGLSLELTKNEVKILSYLIKNKGKIVSRDVLMTYLWQSDFYVDDSTLTVNVTRLRKKLEEIDISDVIQTKRGLGYMMP